MTEGGDISGTSILFQMPEEGGNKKLTRRYLEER